MTAITKTKGDLGQAMIMADALKRGYKIALPLGEDWRYDLIIERKKQLLRVQCKYVEAIRNVIKVRCETHDGRSYHKYKSDDLDFIAVYDKITDKCYYIDRQYLGSGRSSLSLRINEPKNNQKKKILYAEDFLIF